jgi:hypothetical protein
MVLSFHTCYLLVSFTFLVVSLDSLFNLILFSWVCSIVPVVIIVGLKYTSAWFALDLKLWEQRPKIIVSLAANRKVKIQLWIFPINKNLKKIL